MKKIVIVVLLLCFVGCGEQTQDKYPVILGEADFYQIPALNSKEATTFGTLMAALNTPREQQRAVLSQIKKYGIRALPALLTGLEQGSSNTQQGCLEALIELQLSESIIEGKRVKNEEILRTWYLVAMERRYQDLYRPVKIKDDEKRDPEKVRDVYRQHLCVLIETMMTPQAALRLLSSISEEKSELVRAAVYRACGRLKAGIGHLPRLIEMYQNEEPGIARDYLWQSIKSMTGKNYPNNPRVWKVWFQKEGL